MNQSPDENNNEIIRLADAPWQEQLANLIDTPEKLTSLLKLSDKEMEEIDRAARVFPMAITPYYASLMVKDNRRCPIRLQSVPSGAELQIAPADIDDPLHEEGDSPVPGLTHRYPDRVMLLATGHCSMFCRHCTRKRRVGDVEQAISKPMIEQAIEYIAETPCVRDVLISGGDPFVLSDGRLEWILSCIRAIKHVEIIRIGTRTPVVLPQRITPELTEMLKRFHPLWINTHFNHPLEFTPQSRKALAMLADAGIPLGNQTVLLRDINDCPLIIRKLCQELVRNRVRPYYLYQCDLSRGIEHFRTPIDKGIEIMEMMIGHTTGFAIPRFVVDAPGGGGKIPLQPNYLISSGTNKTILRNYEGVISAYTEPRFKETSCSSECRICDREYPKGIRWSTHIGLGRLLSDDHPDISMIPEGNIRLQRSGNGCPEAADREEAAIDDETKE